MNTRDKSTYFSDDPEEVKAAQERKRRFRVVIYSPVTGNNFLSYYRASVPAEFRSRPGETRTFVIADDSGHSIQIRVESIP